jgi:hypothetical protein
VGLDDSFLVTMVRNPSIVVLESMDNFFTAMGIDTNMKEPCVCVNTYALA